MKTLSGLDASFLYLECPEMPMHVGSLHLYELPKGFRGSFHKLVRQHVALRLHLAPLFHRKLASMPLNLGHPFWVESHAVDLDFHVRKQAGSQLSLRQVEAACARLHGVLMERDRPLWEFHVFDSVAAPSGKRYGAFYSKIHHAALDGKAGTMLAKALLDVTATPRAVEPPATQHHTSREPQLGALLGHVLTDSMSQYARLLRALPGAASAVGSTLVQRVQQSRQESAEPSNDRNPAAGLLAPMTRFNAAVTPQRSIATASLPFAPCRDMAKAMGISFNDVLLWLCSTALRHFLTRHDSVPRSSLIAAMPVSLREDRNQELNTQASMTLVQLGTQFADPTKRLQAILSSSTKVKHAMTHLKSVLPTDYPSLLAPWLVGGVAKALFKTYSATGLSKRLPMLCNLVISNVPGPQVPLYLAGARMLTFYPLSIVTHGVALNITVQTYAGSVDFGLVADARAVSPEHLQTLAEGLTLAFDEARLLFSHPPTSPKSGTAPARRVAKKTQHSN
jgi:WS/DGAT/MGAT family acyltransferase